MNEIIETYGNQYDDLNSTLAVLQTHNINTFDITSNIVQTIMVVTNINLNWKLQHMKSKYEQFQCLLASTKIETK